VWNPFASPTAGLDEIDAFGMVARTPAVMSMTTKVTRAITHA
jgi:hypothetical protein